MQATLKLLSIYSIEIRSTSWTTQSGHPKKKEKKAKKRLTKNLPESNFGCWVWTALFHRLSGAVNAVGVVVVVCWQNWGNNSKKKKKKKQEKNTAQLGEIFFDTSFKLKIVEDAKYNCQSPLRFLLFVPLCMSGVCVCVWQTCQIKLFLPSYGTALVTN